jgi:hypothetical protein
LNLRIRTRGFASRASRAAARAAAIAVLAISTVCSPAFAQANGLEEGGVVDKRGEPTPIDDKAFDCLAFKTLIGGAGGGFKAIRGALRSERDTVATYAVTESLFGSCEITEKKKIGEIIYSCEAAKLELADIKATVEACLGDQAFGYAGNENPNTPFLRYNPRIGETRARVLALTTFGKKTLAIMAQP